MSASRDHFQRHRLSTDEYRRMAEHGIIAPDARVELIDGEIIDMPPIGSSRNGIVNHLIRLFVRTVADSTLAYDHDIKAPLYARYRVPEYWLINVAGERVTAFADPGDVGYDTRGALVDPRAVAPAALPGSVLDLAALFRT